MAFTGTGGGRFLIRRAVSGSGTSRFMSDIAKPGVFTTTPPPLTIDTTAVNSAGDTLSVAFENTNGRVPVTGDLFIVVFTDESCAFQYSRLNPATEPRWTPAAAFIDGNLVVDGTVFSNISLAAGITDPQIPLVWAPSLNINSTGFNIQGDVPTEMTPILDTTESAGDPANPGVYWSGAFMGFAGNPASPAVDTSVNVTGRSIQQEILLVGNSSDHLFWDGESLTLSGVTIEDPTILVTAPPLPVDDQWNAMTDYAIGAIVSFENMIYVALVANTNVQPDTDTTVWQPSETVSPSVTIAAAQPVMRTHGDLWYDSSIGRLFLFYADDPAVDPTVGTWADVTKN